MTLYPIAQSECPSVPYAELQVTSNYSFLRGSSHPAELVMRAAELGHQAIAITDRNSLAGIVRAHVAAREAGIKLVVGCQLVLRDGIKILTYPTDRVAYGRLCRLLTRGKRRAPKGECWLDLDDVLEFQEGLILAPVADKLLRESWEIVIGGLLPHLQSRLYLAVACRYRGDDAAWLEYWAGQAMAKGLPFVATNDVIMHDPARRELTDIMTCIRHGCTIDEAGYLLLPHAEHHIKTAKAMLGLFAAYPEALAQGVALADRCRFSLDELSYSYPREVTRDQGDPQKVLEDLTWRGAALRYPLGVPDKIRHSIDHELRLIARLDYAPYFLTVQDMVRFAQSRGILCQGRGSAANSTVCYCLGVTSVDPNLVDLLFERFISAERNEPPDIDVDFEHERREEVMQYVYQKYGRHRAGLAATVIAYRGRSAIRDVGKALGLSLDTVGALAATLWGWSDATVPAERLQAMGLDPGEPRLAATLRLSQELIGFPRHLSQHVGGFVITEEPLEEIVPIENAAMKDRTVVEWDKDDLDALRILKVDVLALGMLTCVRKAFDLLARHHGRALSLATVPPDDPATYDMLCRADSIGVFQVESRAQMTMLPRLRPRNFYDLVIEVAIVRPGPIQGDMVHPYLRRRRGEEIVTYPSQDLAQVLSKTLGVPLFQEQAMRIAIVAAGFTPAEADQLRRAMATFRRNGNVGNFRQKMIDGMVVRGYAKDFAERCFRQIEGFGEYGFPESHAASFALLVYVSAWLKCHYPAVFAAALLNSQPLGFYAPAQLVRDAADHGVEIRPIDINRSDWDCTLEPAPDSAGGQALRLGFRQASGVNQDDMRRLVERRGNGYPDPVSLWRRAGLKSASLRALAEADAFGSMGLDRRGALWAVGGLSGEPLPLFKAAGEEEQGPEAPVMLPLITLGESVAADYAAVGLSLKSHPMALIRDQLPSTVRPAMALRTAADGTFLSVAGLVLVRQRPGTASGVIFLTLEDETGNANIVVWPQIFKTYRPMVMGARVLQVQGKLQREGDVVHLVARNLWDLSHLLADLSHDVTDPQQSAIHPEFQTARPSANIDTDRLRRDFRSRDFH